MTTATLTAGALDADTFTELWRENRDVLRGYLKRRHPRAADELTSETFARAWAGRHTYRPEVGSARTWLFQIARNTLVDLLRYEARRPVLFLDTILCAAFDDSDDRPEVFADPADVAGEVAGRLTALAVLASLPERQRRVLALRFLFDQSEVQTAQVLGIPRGTVKSATCRALRSLAAQVVTQQWRAEA